MRSAFYWGPTGLSMTENNPYGGLLARSMSKLGIELVSADREALNEEWVEENRGKIDVLHIHHPWYHYASEDLEEATARASAFMGGLSRARMLGYKVVWTVHNLYPHDSRHLHLDRMVRLELTSLADSLIVHCENGRRCAEEHFSRTEGVYTIPHGHFIDAYPNTMSRKTARKEFGIGDDAFVYLFFSNLRRYKGVERLVETFSALSGENLRLLLAVKVKDDYSRQVVDDAVAADPRVLVRTSEFFPVDDFQLFMNVSDVVVFPFQEVLTSGSVITAMSFRKPVIVPALGCLPELVDDRMGVVYDPTDKGGLRKAMEDVQGYDLGSCGQEAFEAASRLSWDGIAEKTAEVYRA